MAMPPDKRMCNVHDDVIRCWDATAKFKFYQYFFHAQFGAKPTNLKTANISDYTVYTLQK